MTPDEVCQNGLIRFESENPNFDNETGYLTVSYIWLLMLCSTYRGNRFFEDLLLLDYPNFWSKEGPTGFSWADFEKLMIKIRKIKSLVFDEGETVTVGELHKGAIMDRDTERIRFINHHLTNDVAVRCKYRKIRSATNASAAGAMLTLDSRPRRTDKSFSRLHFKEEEHDKSASGNDISILFCTSSVPSLQTHDMPHGTGLVAKENWDKYFGPYASRCYLVARETLRKRSLMTGRTGRHLNDKFR